MKTPSNSTTMIDYIQIYPSNTSVEYDAIRLGLGARLYKLSKKHPQHKEFVQLIESYMEKTQALKATFDQANTFLIALEIPSKEETAKWETTNKELYKINSTPFN